MNILSIEQQVVITFHYCHANSKTCVHYFMIVSFQVSCIDDIDVGYLIRRHGFAGFWLSAALRFVLLEEKLAL